MTGPCSGRPIRQRITTLDKYGRGSTGPIVGQGRIKDKHNYQRPQAEEKDNFHHGARQRGVGYEETIGINQHYLDA
jgi:hypothetical protein